jgi:putative oxidoreductase
LRGYEVESSQFVTFLSAFVTQRLGAGAASHNLQLVTVRLADRYVSIRELSKRRPRRGEFMIGTKTQPSRYAPYALSGLRFFVALTFLAHGTHKYFNFPPGASYEGIDLTTLHGWAGTIELFGGTLLLLGLFTRAVAFLASGEMAIGYWLMHAPQSPFPMVNSGESAYLFCFTFLFFVFAGPGPISLDALLGFDSAFPLTNRPDGTSLG